MFTQLAKLLGASKRKEEGFTLIELLIVVAIIAILAAIAIPQFSAYRIRGYNTAATADLRNSRTTLEAFFSDWQVYPSTAAAAAAGAGAVYTNTTGVLLVPLNGISLTAPSAPTSASYPVSAGVILVINTTAGTGASYIGVTKNSAGDKCYAMDADATQTYWMNGTIGGLLVAGTIPAAAGTTNELIPNIASIAPCAGGAVTVWTPIT